MAKRNEFLPYGQQSISDDDIAAVLETLQSPFLTTGPKIKEFENAVANYVGVNYAVAFSNGTAALHGACFAAGIEKGDEVITTPITFAASANCVRYMDGTVVFADIDKKTYNIDPLEIQKKITSNTKAIIPVDFTGQPVDMDEIMTIAQQHSLVVIEDAAHALGADYKDRKVGATAHMTMFSFHPVKPITTAEGGMIVTNDKTYYDKLLSFRSHGITHTPYSEEQGAWYYEMIELGYNYRMTDIQAALGLSQMAKLDKFIEKRRELANLYTMELKENQLVHPPMQNKNALSGWHLYSIQLDLDKLGKTRRMVFDEMRASNIGVHVHYIPVYWHPYYEKLGYKKGICPIAENWYEHALTLPLFPKMTAKDIKDVVQYFKKE
ncbi:UDP-4-amino-4,6-dideoxy-N-acetyl-beta-L-altrosamine transaminase [Kurthia sibirica]|uniref:UDP-4-amino-4, 6-dideoxy-N-acetyl-beta-L-altrosamine transaminase n=1 Tax=Kurthia sibirica TaxID=202750 RepID=A0A2U3AMP4_9BACL|nr:UDP-4-amino-4,6-dideoxy-N-acetyl-beta-L-altrosamine transaminase [Kurthia sibirica]PWI25805.1 UDP-4-amino-4,6-dideoxy-N-acetyl-beta-L-altrosamine transaminase [Kurthia sibirica]GEK33623.1 UDP-4-amino-4,6-dideoxy-N-acetyl-beta-L-altrosamine transaminase [Kurthia sibirica]